jgi:hypothetical protein
MVDALRRASRWVKADGCVIDVHPTNAIPPIEVAGRRVGHVATPDGPARHAAADAALRESIASGLYVEAASATFDFYTWGDTLDELRDHIEENWCDARVVVRDGGAGRARAIEHVRMTKLVLARARV